MPHITSFGSTQEHTHYDMSFEAHVRDQRVPYLRTPRSDEPERGGVAHRTACPYAFELACIAALTACLTVVVDFRAVAQRLQSGERAGMPQQLSDGAFPCRASDAAGACIALNEVSTPKSISELAAGVVLTAGSSSAASRLLFAVVLGISICVGLGSLVKAAHTRSLRKADLALQLGMHTLPITLCMLVAAADASLVLRSANGHVVNLAAHIAWSLSSYSIARLFHRMCVARGGRRDLDHHHLRALMCRTFYAAGVEHASPGLDVVIVVVAFARELLTVVARVTSDGGVMVACSLGVALCIVASIALKVHVMRPFFARTGVLQPSDRLRLLTASRVVDAQQPPAADDTSSTPSPHAPASVWSLMNGNTTMTLTLTSVVVGMMATDATAIAHALDMASPTTVEAVLCFAIAARVLLLFACSVVVMLVEDEAQISDAMMRVMEMKIKAASDDNKRRVYRILFHELRVPLNSIALGLSLLQPAGSPTESGSADSDTTTIDNLAPAAIADGSMNDSPSLAVHVVPATTTSSTSAVVTAAASISIASASQLLPTSLHGAPLPQPVNVRSALAKDPDAIRPDAGRPAVENTSPVATPSMLMTYPPQADHGSARVSPSRGNAETIAFMRENATQMISLLSDMLDLERMEARAFDVRYAPVNLNGLLQTCVRAGMTQARAHHVHLSSVYDSHLPLMVCADALRLQQIMTNYATNAVKFTRPGVKSFVRLSASAVPLADVEGLTEPGVYAPTGDHAADFRSGDVIGVRLACEDNGIGVEEAAIGKLFTAFSQPNPVAEHRDDSGGVVHSQATARGLRGTGVGLDICRQIAELHNGRVGCTSSPGNGSTFFALFRMRTLLPAAPDAHPVHLPATSAAAPTSHTPLETLQPRIAAAGVVTAAPRSSNTGTGAAAGPAGLRAADMPQSGVLKYDLPPLERVLISEAPRAAAAPLPAAGGTNTLPPLRVLVVDDDGSNRRLLARAIRQRMAPVAAITIDEAGDGIAALERCRTQVYDIVCMDARMPRMGGEECVRGLRAAGVTAHIVGVTGDADAEQTAQFRAVGADAVMLKPVDVDALVRQFTEVLQRITAGRASGRA